MTTIVIDKFLGLHQDSTGDTNLLLGELSECLNVRITENYKARKREGYAQLFNSIANKKIQGMWYGLMNGTYLFLFACNGHVYRKLDDNTYTDLGTLADTPTTFFQFGDNVYIQNGNEYYKWTGVGSIQVVAGYRPLIGIATPPSGGGTAFEGINLLTGQKRQTFRSDGTATTYYLAETNIGSIDFVKYLGTTLTLGTDYTQNLTDGTISMTVVKPNWTGETDDVDIGWTKGTGQRSSVTSYCYNNLYGGQNDTRVFLYGNGTNKMIYSDLANGVPSAEYFPANNYQEIGNKDAITYVTKQYDRQVIFTRSKAFYSIYSNDISGIIDFPVFPLNDKIGNYPKGQGQVILNNPFTITHSVYQWQATNVRDERNALYMSQRVQLGLDKLDLNNAITVDYESLGEMWICVGHDIYVYSYRYDVWYRFYFNDTPTCFLEIDGALYFGTTNGQIMKFCDDYIRDNGYVIEAKLETGFLDFGEAWRRKFLNFAWVGLEPEVRSKAVIEWESDYSASRNPETIQYNLIDFGNIDFGDFTFDVNYNPQPFRLKLKAKKFTYIKIIITNTSTTDRMTILNITLPAEIGGISK